MPFGWRIDVDYDANGGNDARGVNGPAEAPPHLVRFLNDDGPFDPSWLTAVFHLYDDQGRRAYSGLLVSDEGESVAAARSPLVDFGQSWAGCTQVRYPHRPWLDNDAG